MVGGWWGTVATHGVLSATTAKRRVEFVFALAGCSKLAAEEDERWIRIAGHYCI